MNKLFKTILYTSAFTILFTNVAKAENYIMLSNESITAVECQNSGVISVKPLSTLMNDKRTIIISPLKDGVADFKVKLKNRTLGYKATVKDNKIEFKGNRVIKIVPLDLPPEILPQGDNCQ